MKTFFFFIGNYMRFFIGILSKNKLFLCEKYKEKQFSTRENLFIEKLEKQFFFIA